MAIYRLITLHTNAMTLDLDTVIYMYIYLCFHKWHIIYGSFQEKLFGPHQVERNVFHYSAGIHACETLELEQVM